MAIDYARMQKSGPKLKAQLTRATKIADPMKRYLAVLVACKTAVTEWNAVGAWIDDWSRWQRALLDAAANLHSAGVFFIVPRLEEL